MVRGSHPGCPPCGISGEAGAKGWAYIQQFLLNIRILLPESLLKWALVSAIRHASMQIFVPMFQNIPPHSPAFFSSHSLRLLCLLLPVYSTWECCIYSELSPGPSFSSPTIFYPTVVHSCVRAARRKYHKMGDFHSRSVLSHSSGS